MDGGHPLRVRFHKQKHKFAAAHFTIYPDGKAERLHGHNYTVEATLHAKTNALEGGISVPFHIVKDVIQQLCDRWHERVLIPQRNRYLEVVEEGEQWQLTLATPFAKKFYSLPKEDVVLLNCDNISCENLALLAGDLLAGTLPSDVCRITEKLTLTISEGPGSEVSVDLTFG
eukprot:Sspe_Gene.60768::Locus_33544_Transcript_6_6_Confidence_0.500_Length_4303::g.60768::m.60768/K01737/queD, ptpS, PTS; 6-pyruvoyltetrahydropterin/6-carboxytetrahydropterin synthase